MRRAFTLLETILVIAVVGLLLGLLLPAIQMVRERSARTDCQNRLRQIGLALTQHHNDHGRLPWLKYSKLGGFHRTNWHVHILPYLDQQALFNQAAAENEASPSQYNHEVGKKVLPAYLCPLDDRLRNTYFWLGRYEKALTSYTGVAGGLTVDGMLLQHRIGVSFNEVHDGLSQTVMVGEKPPFETNLLPGPPWYSQLLPPGVGDATDGSFGGPVLPTGLVPFGPGRIDNPADSWHFWSLHPGGANFVFGDTSVRFLRHSAAKVLVDLGTRAGNEAPADLD